MFHPFPSEHWRLTAGVLLRRSADRCWVWMPAELALEHGSVFLVDQLIHTLIDDV